jgi:hypothetical protein
VFKWGFARTQTLNSSGALFVVLFLRNPSALFNSKCEGAGHVGKSQAKHKT